MRTRLIFHKWKKQLAIVDKLAIAVFIVMLGFLRADVVVIFGFAFLVPYLFLTERRNLFNHLLISFTLAFVWILIGNNQYGYNTKYTTFFGLQLFPLFSFTLGIFAVYLIFSHYEHLLPFKGFAAKLISFTALYVFFVLLFETVGYHVFNIKNIATAAFPGLPICDCIHAPRWMQAAYLSFGTVFFAIAHALKLENPHYKVKK